MERCVVIGGGSGIGAATAERFAAAGLEVVVNGRDPAKLDAVTSAIGDRARPLVADATDRQSLWEALAGVGAVDHLVICASGGAGGGPFAELDPGVLRAAFDAKFWAQFNVLQAALPVLSERASVTLVTAGSARAALPGTSGLAAVNGALEAMVGPLAAELRPRRVNAVSPGIIRTGWWDAMPDADREAMFANWAAGVPAGRIGTPEEVADAIYLLATATFVTGTVLDCAGGAHLAITGGLA